jgi:hypothetical protein
VTSATASAVVLHKLLQCPPPSLASCKACFQPTFACCFPAGRGARQAAPLHVLRLRQQRAVAARTQKLGWGGQGRRAGRAPICGPAPASSQRGSPCQAIPLRFCCSTHVVQPPPLTPAQLPVAPASAAAHSAGVELVHPYDRNGRVWGREEGHRPAGSAAAQPLLHITAPSCCNSQAFTACHADYHSRPPHTNTPPHPHLVQLESSAYATHGLQAALDDYRRACYDAAAAVRKHLRQLATSLQVGPRLAVFNCAAAGPGHCGPGCSPLACIAGLPAQPGRPPGKAAELAPLPVPPAAGGTDRAGVCRDDGHCGGRPGCTHAGGAQARRAAAHLFACCPPLSPPHWGPAAESSPGTTLAAAQRAVPPPPSSACSGAAGGCPL